MSNLRLINQTEITSSISSISIKDVFSDDFDIYKIIVNGMSTTGTTNTEVYFRFLNSAGGVIVTPNYQHAMERMRSDTTVGSLNQTGQTSMRRLFGINTDQAPETQSGVAYVFNPSNTSTHSFVLAQSSTNFSSVHRNNKMIGVLPQASNVTGFNLFEVSSRPFNSGRIKTYGLRIDS
tara:strand:+ start:552 stop:1085 length:534 start_codon:yes stop_codon:yes gene_type:complete